MKTNFISKQKKLEKENYQKSSSQSQELELFPNQTDPILDAALGYLEAGISPIPLVLKFDAKEEKYNKSPIVKWKKYQTELPSKEWVISTFSAKKPEMVGIITGCHSGLLMIGPDSEEGNKYIKQFGLPPNTPTVSTGKPGHFHYYFRYPKGVQIKTKANIKGLEFDIRGEGGYAVAPPSRRPRVVDKLYEWVVPLDMDTLPEIPAELLEIIRERDYSDKTPTNKSHKSENHSKSNRKLDIAAILNGLPEGERDDYLTRYAASLRSRSNPKEEALVLIEYAAKNCNPPFDLEEARAKVYRAYEKYPEGFSTDNKFMSGEDLMKTKFPPKEWLVPNIIPKNNIIMLAGKPKTGKSFLALQLLTSLASGIPFLGIPLEFQRVCYINLEEDGESLQSRIKKQNINCSPTFYKNLFFQFDCPALGTEAGRTDLERILADKSLSLVVIDTWSAAIQTKFEENNVSDVQPILNGLRDIVKRLSITIVIIHHDRKGKNSGDPIENLRGSSVLGASADIILGLQKEKQEERMLYVVGRSVRDQDITLTFDSSTCTFEKKEVTNERKMTECHQKFIKALYDLGGKADSISLRETLKISKPRLGQIAKPLVKEGKIEEYKERGKTTIFTLKLQD